MGEDIIQIVRSIKSYESELNRRKDEIRQLAISDTEGNTEFSVDEWCCAAFGGTNVEAYLKARLIDDYLNENDGEFFLLHNIYITEMEDFPSESNGCYFVGMSGKLRPYRNPDIDLTVTDTRYSDGSPRDMLNRLLSQSESERKEREEMETEELFNIMNRRRKREAKEYPLILGIDSHGIIRRGNNGIEMIEGSDDVNSQPSLTIDKLAVPLAGLKDGIIRTGEYFVDSHSIVRNYEKIRLIAGDDRVQKELAKISEKDKSLFKADSIYGLYQKMQEHLPQEI